MNSSIAELRASGVDTTRIFWLDATGKSPSSSANISATHGAQALSQLSVLLGGMTGSGNFSFVIFDSLDSLVEKNGRVKALKFALYMVKSLTHRGIGAIFVVKDKRAVGAAFVKRLARECDSTITV